MKNNTLNYTNEWFDAPSKLQQIQASPIHQYCWGGCYLNRQTGLVDFIYHKRTDRSYNVEFQIAPQSGFFNVILENERGGQLCIGIIKSDWTKYRELVKGGSFFLEGIQKSMEKVFAPVVVDENYNEFFG